MISEHINCSECPSYKRGKGTRDCLQCAKYKDIVPRYRPGPPIIKMPAEIVENMPTIIMDDSILKAMQMIDIREATMLMQYTSLDMSQPEIAIYHNVTQQTASNIIKKAAINIREILKKGYV